VCYTINEKSLWYNNYNMNQLKKNPLFYLSLVLVGIISFQFYSVVSAQWSQPSGAPPTSNVAVPLDTSNTIQLKKGSLTISADGIPDGNGGVNPGHAIDFLVNGSQPANLVFDAGATWTALKYDDVTGYFSITNPNGPLFLSDRTLGLRLPNITSSTAAAVSGNVIFDKYLKTLQVYDGANWGSVSGAGISGGETGYLPLWKNATTLATSSLFQDASRNIGINTTAPQTTLSVQGSLSLLRMPGNLPGGPGPQLSLQSPSNTGVATVLKGGLSQCATPGTAPCVDTTPTKDNNTTYTCQASDIGKTYTDVGPWGQSNQILYGDIICTGGTSAYSLQMNNGVLQFLNNGGTSKMSLTQDGTLYVQGDLGTSNINISGNISALGSIKFGKDLLLSKDDGLVYRVGWASSFSGPKMAYERCDSGSFKYNSLTTDPVGTMQNNGGDWCTGVAAYVYLSAGSHNLSYNIPSGGGGGAMVVIDNSIWVLDLNPLNCTGAGGGKTLAISPTADGWHRVAIQRVLCKGTGSGAIDFTIDGHDLNWFQGQGLLGVQPSTIGSF